jgi:hypothetical protein
MPFYRYCRVDELAQLVTRASGMIHTMFNNPLKNYLVVVHISIYNLSNYFSY